MIDHAILNRRYFASDFNRLTNRATSTLGCPAACRTIASIAPVTTSDRRTSVHVRLPDDIQRQDCCFFPSVEPDGKLNIAIIGRTQHSSITANVTVMRSGVAQSFLESPLGWTLAKLSTNRKGDDPTAAKNPCDCCCRCGRVVDRRPDGIKAVRKSRSHSPPRTSVSELSGWASQATQLGRRNNEHAQRQNGPGEAPLERLPAEILGELY